MYFSTKGGILTTSFVEAISYGNQVRTEETKEYYRYNSKNQLTHLEHENGFTQYQYDRQGNLEREVGPQGIKDYSYDALNHQTRVQREDGYRLINRYDGENLRYQTEEDGKIIHFVFDKEQNLSVEEGGNSIRIIRGYEAVARVEGEWEQEGEQEEKGRYQYYTQDEQKSTMYLLDENQEIRNAYRYDAFGNLLEKEEESINRLLYTGQIYDEGTGQYYLRARFYSPAIGRFLQEDVYRGDGLNQYAYCGNNPVMYYDPSGYMSFCNILPSDGGNNIINNKFPNEQMPVEGKLLEYTVENGRIKGINGLNQVDFVITKDGQLLIGNKHHFLGQGQDVLAAGQLKINGQGQIKRIDNLSGHYRPTVSESIIYPKLFEDMGFNLNKSWVDLYDIEIDSSGLVENVTKSYTKMLEGGG